MKWLSKNWKDLVVGVGILALLLFCFDLYKNNVRMREQLSETFQSIHFISSGMSLDESRLRKVLQTEQIIKHYNPSLKSEFVHSLAISIVDAASRYENVDHLILCALIAQESRFDPNAVSPVGAKGLTQIMDGTAEMISWRFTWTYYDGIAFDPEKSVLMGAYYLSRMIDLNKGDVKVGLAYYNGGYKYGAIYKLKHRSKSLNEEEKILISNLPKETAEYPHKVLKHLDFVKEKFKFNLEETYAKN